MLKRPNRARKATFTTEAHDGLTVEPAGMP
jgi:hypothetical protein